MDFANPVMLAYIYRTLLFQVFEHFGSLKRHTVGCLYLIKYFLR